MKIVKPSLTIISDRLPKQMVYMQIESAARICYKSYNSKSAKGRELFIKKLIENGHHSVLEHVSITAFIVCDRGVSHELVRHRLCSFSQESTRYANYSKEKFGKELTVVHPTFFDEQTHEYITWHNAMLDAEAAYMNLLEHATPEEARTVLPNSLKTELYMTANIREWRHIFKLRTTEKAHPQMRELMKMGLDEFKKRIPLFFEDF